MKKRYPWLGITLLGGFAFAGFYLCAYFIVATSYSLLFDRPADQSREISAIYYGFFLSTLPYLPLGSFLYAYARRKPLLLTLHGAGLGLAAEKIVFVYLCTLLGTGYQWYGGDFPRSGHAVLCEELPMFCRPDYILHYHLWGSMLAIGAFYLGAWLVRRSGDLPQPFGQGRSGE